MSVSTIHLPKLNPELIALTKHFDIKTPYSFLEKANQFGYKSEEIFTTFGEDLHGFINFYKNYYDFAVSLPDFGMEIDEKNVISKKAFKRLKCTVSEASIKIWIANLFTLNKQICELPKDLDKESEEETQTRLEQQKRLDTEDQEEYEFTKKYMYKKFIGTDYVTLNAMFGSGPNNKDGFTKLHIEKPIFISDFMKRCITFSERATNNSCRYSEILKIKMQANLYNSIG